MIFKSNNLLCGGTDLAPLDVREDDVRVRVLRLDLGWAALSALARPIRALVEPIHLLLLVVPDGDGQNHCEMQG